MYNSIRRSNDTCYTYSCTTLLARYNFQHRSSLEDLSIKITIVDARCDHGLFHLDNLMDGGASRPIIALYRNFHKHFRRVYAIENYVNSWRSRTTAQWPRSIPLRFLPPFPLAPGRHHTLRRVKNVHPVERSKFSGADNERRTLTKGTLSEICSERKRIPSSLHKCILSLRSRIALARASLLSNRVLSSRLSLSLSLSLSLFLFLSFRAEPASVPRCRSRIFLLVDFGSRVRLVRLVALMLIFPPLGVTRTRPSQEFTTDLS